MKKPRCFQCDAALKRIYERKGSNATFNTVQGWWYCNDCRKMQKGPHYPSVNPDDYLDSEAADKFPKISHIMQHSNQYIDIEELNDSFYQKINYDPELTNKYENILQFFMTGQKASHQIKRDSEPVLKSFWYCSQCEETKMMDEKMLGEEDDLDAHAPTHCDKKMVITIKHVEEETPLEKLQESITDIVHEYRKCEQEGDYEQAAIYLLDLTLNYLAWPRAHFTFHRETFAPFLAALKKPDNPLHDTWGFQMLISFVYAYMTPNSDIELALLTGKYHRLQVPDFKENPETIPIIQSVISDIISGIPLLEEMPIREKLSKIPYYRQLGNKIILKIRHRQQFRENMKEYRRLKELRHPQQVSHELQKL